MTTVADWQLDLMYESESARMWEEQNTPTDGEKLRLAGKSLDYAISDLNEGCDRVNEAAELLVDTPEGDRVVSILDDMKKVLKDLAEMRDAWRAV